MSNIAYSPGSSIEDSTEDSTDCSDIEDNEITNYAKNIEMINKRREQFSKKNPKSDEDNKRIKELICKKIKII